MWGRSERSKMRGIRPPVVAGLFYPGEPGPLRRMVERFLGDAERDSAGVPKAIIAPHAGYPYSGPVAGSSFEPFRPLSGRVERVVVLGPSHHVPFRGLALPAAECFDGPLGKVEIDLEAAESLLDLPQVAIDDGPHSREHALEVEVPFLQQVLGDFRIVPLVVGRAEPHEVAEVLERLWGGAESRIVISSDLSHYLDYKTARHTDASTADAILELRTSIHPQQACGAMAINGLLELASQKSLRGRLIDLRSSGDTAGSRDQVVGYGAFAFGEG